MLYELVPCKKGRYNMGAFGARMNLTPKHPIVASNLASAGRRGIFRLRGHIFSVITESRRRLHPEATSGLAGAELTSVVK